MSKDTVIEMDADRPTNNVTCQRCNKSIGKGEIAYFNKFHSVWVCLDCVQKVGKPK